jgi:branched-chain amino acid transport system substrate-binding protein
MKKLTSRIVAMLSLVTLYSISVVGHAAQEVVFGQIASQTNPASAANAKGLVVGIQTYFDKVNAKGGIAGNTLKLLTLDDDLQGSKMLELTQQLIADPAIVGLLGFLNSAGLAEVAKQNIPANAGIALITPLQGDKNVVDAVNVFPLRSGYTDEVNTLLKEAKNWGKNEVAIVNMGIAFGPPLAQLAIKQGSELGIKISTHQVIDASPTAFDASVKSAVAAVSKSQPKAILLLAAGKPAFEFIRAFRETPGGSVQIYGLSVMQHDMLVKAVGVDKARGIVLSQAIPYPFVPSRAVINEYLFDMKKYAPKEMISFSSLEGYLGAKIAAEAVRRAGKQPNRTKVLAALSNLGEFDLGGIYVKYTSAQRKGWGGVELSIINADGVLKK